MKGGLDLTEGPIPGLIVRLSTPIILSMLMFTLYLAADLFFVSRLGPDAVAAVSISGNAFFFIFGLSIILGTGGMALIARHRGAGDHERARGVLVQILLATAFTGLLVSLTGWSAAEPYIHAFGGTGASLALGKAYFRIYAISFFPLLLLQVLATCFRGLGDTKTPMAVTFFSLGLNVLLDPLLIFGTAGLPALGVCGAAWATLISQGIGLGIYARLLFRGPSRIGPQWTLRPDLPVLARALSIGGPSGVTYFLIAVNMLVVYRLAAAWGTPALAALGIGYRILQSTYLPAVAVSSAMAAVVAQNAGARRPSRIVQALWTGWALTTVFMLLGTALCGLAPSALIGIFTSDPEVMAYGREYLTVLSLGNVLVGTIMALSSVFLGLGKTVPTLVASAVDVGLFALLGFTLPHAMGWGILSLWWLKLSTASVETGLIAFWLSRHWLRVRGVELQAVAAPA